MFVQLFDEILLTNLQIVIKYTCFKKGENMIPTLYDYNKGNSYEISMWELENALKTGKFVKSFELSNHGGATLLTIRFKSETDEREYFLSAQPNAQAKEAINKLFQFVSTFDDDVRKVLKQLIKINKF